MKWKEKENLLACGMSETQTGSSTTFKHMVPGDNYQSINNNEKRKYQKSFLLLVQ